MTILEETDTCTVEKTPDGLLIPFAGRPRPMTVSEEDAKES
jgi:hypothetical protein